MMMLIDAVLAELSLSIQQHYKPSSLEENVQMKAEFLGNWVSDLCSIMRGSGEETVAWKYFTRDVVPFAAMFTVECTTVGSNTLFKAASLRGLSFYVFLFYSYVVATLLLLPLSFIFGRSRRLPPAKSPLFFKIFLLGLLGFMAQLAGSFTFTLAVIFRMERVVLRSSATQAKIIGAIVSISGALTRVMEVYPEEITVVFFYNVFSVLIAGPVCLFAESNLTSWVLKPDISLAAIIYSGAFVSIFSALIHTWGLHLKGPVYISLFRPLSIAIAVAMGAIFLGDALHLGSVIGSVI
ncbi:unnamed protein product [Microthlaspi erraticum]|uniref:WAT1-related protein n=1 Tax=Microthlaspi erraticum TaxID=1685480 RepID=A0A6D2I4G8_9BRAS|nr:unnamed protein product [Microthlaspi erraticum]